MKNKDEMNLIRLVVYYADIDEYSEEPLGDLITFEIGMHAAARNNFPKRWIIGAFSSSEEAQKHIKQLKA